MRFRIAIITVWLCMAAWLVRYEAFPEYFSDVISGYRSLLSKEVLVMDSWMQIILGGTAIGYSHTGMDINENNPNEHYTIENRIHVGLNIAGVRKNIHALTSIMLDTAYNLSRFNLSLSSPVAVIKVEGVRKEGNTFEVKADTQSGQTNRYSVQIPHDVVLYSPLAETALKNLKPGQQAMMRTLDPVSMTKANLRVQALRREKITISGEQLDSTVLSTEYQGIKMFSWIDEKGTVLRQESPIGLAMQKCTPEEAYAAALGTPSSDEVLKAILPLIFIMENKHD